MTLKEWLAAGHTLPQDIATEFLAAIAPPIPITEDGVNYAFTRRYYLRELLDEELTGCNFDTLIETAAQTAAYNVSIKYAALSDSSEDGETYYPTKTTATNLRTPQSSGEYRDGAVETVAELTGATPGQIITRRKSSTNSGDRRRELMGLLDSYLAGFEKCFKGAISAI